MKIYVVGAGGVGGFYGGMLAKAGFDVWFVARGGHGEAVRKNGLQVKSVVGDFKIHPVQVIGSVKEISSPNLILICTKTYHLNEIAKDLESIVNPETLIITFQNGLDADLTLKNILKNCKIHPGVAYIISQKSASGVITQSAGPRTLVFGSRLGEDQSMLDTIEETFRKAQIDACHSRTIQSELWEKFIWILSFAGITSACRSSIGKIVNDTESYDFIMKLVDEGFNVAEAAGVMLPADAKDKIRKKFENYKDIGGTAKSSLLVDIENKLPTELDAIHGKFLQIANELKIEVPLNKLIYCSLKHAVVNQ